jgi:non-canonical poly(A) RNA polymerase PAPD5/7
MTEYDSKEQRLHDEIVAFTEYLKPTSEERRVRQEVVARVAKCGSARFRDALVRVFGSVAQDLSFPDGCVISLGSL